MAEAAAEALILAEEAFKMARFSQAFLQGLLRPTYEQGLFNVAQQAADLPRQRQEAKRMQDLQKGLFGLEQMAASGQLTPEMYQQALGRYSNLITDDRSAQMIRQTMGRVSADVRGASQFEAGVEINAIRERMYEVARSELPEAEKNRRLAELQVEANQAAKEGRLDPMEVGNLLRSVKQDMFAREQQNLEAQRVAERHQITLEEAEMRVEKFQRWRDQGWFEELKMRVDGQVLKDQELKIKARGKQLTRDQFIQQYGSEKSYVYDEIEAENLEIANRISDAREMQKSGKFTYSDDELKAFGFNSVEIEALKNSPARDANATVLRRVAQIPTVTKPNAAMVARIADALLIDVMTEENLDFDETDDLAKGKAIASKRALRVQELMMQGKTFDEAIADDSVSTTAQTDPSDDIDAVLSQALEMLGEAD